MGQFKINPSQAKKKLITKEGNFFQHVRLEMIF